MTIQHASADLTAIVLTYNESLHIERCIRNLQGFARDVVIIDSYSSDDTVDIARRLGARVYQNPWTNHAVQFNWALDNVPVDTGWIIRVDADEYLEPGTCELSAALRKMSPGITGLTIKRKYYFMGKWIRHGTMYPVQTLRIFRTGRGRVENRWMDEHIVLSSGKAGMLDLNIVDDNLNSVGWWIQKHNDYATKEMLEALDLKYHFLEKSSGNRGQQDKRSGWKRWVKENVYARLPVFVRPLLYFLYRYFLRLGFLDGSKGFAFHFMQGLWYRSLVDLKMMEAEQLIRTTGASSPRENPEAKPTKSPSEIRAMLARRTGLDL